MLWAGPTKGNDAVSLIAESALATKSMIENVEFVVVANKRDAEQLQADVTERDLPVTIAAFDQVEPLIDLIERTWACVTVPSRGLPHGYGMFAASAGVSIVSVGELDESHGVNNHLNYMGVESDSHDAVAYALQLLRRWSTWSLRIGSAGQQLIEDRFGLDTDTQSDEPAEEEDMYSGAGFDLVAAALAGLSAEASATESEPTKDAGSSADMGQDAISALFSADEADPEIASAPPVDLDGVDMDQDAISALFAANDPAPAAEPAGDMGQDAISALVAANDPAPAAEPAGDMG